MHGAGSYWHRGTAPPTDRLETRLNPRLPCPQTVRFKNELVRNITIKLGYANAKIYKSKAECVGAVTRRLCGAVVGNCAPPLSPPQTLEVRSSWLCSPRRVRHRGRR